MSRYSDIRYFVAPDRLPPLPPFHCVRNLAVVFDSLFSPPLPMLLDFRSLSSVFFLRGFAITARLDRVGYYYFILQNLISPSIPHPLSSKRILFPFSVSGLYLSSLFISRGPYYTVHADGEGSGAALPFPLDHPPLALFPFAIVDTRTNRFFSVFSSLFLRGSIFTSSRGSEGPLPLCLLNTRRRHHQYNSFRVFPPTTQHCFRSLAVPPTAPFFFNLFFGHVFLRAFAIDGGFSGRPFY